MDIEPERLRGHVFCFARSVLARREIGSKRVSSYFVDGVIVFFENESRILFHFNTVFRGSKGSALRVLGACGAEGCSEREGICDDDFRHTTMRYDTGIGLVSSCSSLFGFWWCMMRLPSAICTIGAAMGSFIVATQWLNGMVLWKSNISTRNLTIGNRLVYG